MGSFGGSNSKSSSSPNLSLRTRIFLCLYCFALDRIFCSSFGFVRRLGTLFDIKVPAYSSSGVSASDVYLDSSRNLWLRLYRPSAANLPLIVYFHGGGFLSLAANSVFYDHFCRRLARELPAVVASVNYRLSPDHKFPAQHNDGFDALQFLESSGCLPESTDLRRCFLAGDSAGGNIAHHVALRACNDDKLRKLRVVGIIAIQPFFGGEERTESEIRCVRDLVLNVDRTDWMWRSWLPEGSDRDHPAVNVTGGKAAAISGKKFPGAIVFAGGFDPLQEWQRRYCEWLQRSGKEVRLVEYPAAIHAFCVFPDIPESDLLINEVKTFVTQQFITAMKADD